MFDDRPAAPVGPPDRDGVGPLAQDGDEPPTIVSISDIHGQLQEARSALLTLQDHPDFDPIVRTDPAMRLQWADNNYVLVFNGDLIDRGPRNERVVELVQRLMQQAPPGRVRVIFGNHEMGILTPDYFGWDRWYSAQLSEDQRRDFIDCIRDGHVVAAYDGYNVTYAHAGRAESYDTHAINEQLIAAAEVISDTVGSTDELAIQREVTDTYPDVLGLGPQTGRGPGSGIAWLDFEFMPEDAPPQVVGHTRQKVPRQKGAVICENVIRTHARSDGGEAVVVETPDSLRALIRDVDGGVTEREFTVPTPPETPH